MRYHSRVTSLRGKQHSFSAEAVDKEEQNNELANHIHRKTHCSFTLTHPLADAWKACAVLKDHVKAERLRARQVTRERVITLVTDRQKPTLSQNLFTALSTVCPSRSACLSSIVALLRCKCQQNRWMERTSLRSDTMFMQSHANTAHKHTPRAQRARTPVRSEARR